MLHRVRTINLTQRRISLDICGQGRLSGGGRHKLALKGGKIGGRRGHFQMVKEIGDEKMKRTKPKQ